MKKIKNWIGLLGFITLSAYAEPSVINARVIASEPVIANKQIISECKTAINQNGDNWQDYFNQESIVGGIVGALVGRNFGDGSGKKVATITGALAGAYIGNNMSKNNMNDCVNYSASQMSIQPYLYNIIVEVNNRQFAVLRNENPTTQTIPVFVSVQ